MNTLLVAIDLVAPPFVPRPLRGLYDRTVGARAAQVREQWMAADEAWQAAA